MVRLSEIGARVHALCSCVHFLSERCEVSTAKAMGSSRNRTQVLCMSAVPLHDVELLPGSGFVWKPEGISDGGGGVSGGRGDAASGLGAAFFESG